MRGQDSHANWNPGTRSPSRPGHATCWRPLAYLIEIRGHPQVNLRVEVLPQDMASMSLEEMLAIGSVITAMPVVNAIPAVIAARPGVVTYADLPTQASRHVPHGS